MGFLTTVFMVRNSLFRDCALIAALGIWGLGHVFEDKLYFTKDIVDDSFVPKNRKPKPISKPAAEPAPKPAPKGKHVQLFKIKCKVGKGFYSVPVDGQ